MAELGKLIKLEKLDMTGCRGDERELERKIWECVYENRGDTGPNLKAIEATIRGLRERAAALEKEAKYHEEIAAERRKKAETARRKADELEGKTEPEKQPVHDGMVIGVDGDVVVISLGKDDGVRAGFKYIVSRGADYVATIEVTEVDAIQSTAKIIKSLKKKDIERGDKVMNGG